ncbi:uncharacterized protein F5147DRAFT_658188 [Suillus discolor]|uniref:C2H2-type domain-containing protein n=1 Tax=Suillus discolor TaxID=1912936 RepID=A0A9P7EU59_9AGAM|nr:uncharacterized protein F5147DRAFT_658188 [Suillus discolor]KAG2090392.1 hypothetical protein F5147DRAFT_658188 [Suillus discolor]
MNLKCGGECNRLFSAPRSLTHHRQTCKHWQRQLTLQSQHFKHISASLQDSQAPPAKKMKFSAQIPSSASESPPMPMNIVTSDSSDIPASLPSINDSAVASSSASALDIVQEEQPENQAGRPSRTHRLPLRFRDELPVPPPAIPAPASTNVVHRVVLYVFDSFRTSLNQFGIGWEYHHRPSYDPDAFVSVEQLSNIMFNFPFP